jgi:hypothetical protein
MPLNFPAPQASIPRWRELTPRPVDALDLHNALGLLIQSFGAPYERYSNLGLRRMMRFRDGLAIPGLRVFIHTVAQQELAAFFFLRAHNPHFDPAYAMSVGVSPLFNNAQTVYNELRTVVAFMETEDPQAIEIMNDRNSPAEGNAILTDVINNYATGNISWEEIVSPGGPWPNDMNRWSVTS